MEIGLAARAGVLFGRDSYPSGGGATFVGGAVGPQLDVRWWIGRRFGIVGAVEAWLATASVSGVSGPYVNESLLAISLPTFSVGAFMRL